VSPSNGATGIAIAPMLDWSSLSGITGYQYRYSTNSNMSAAIYGTTTSSYSYVYLSGLAYGTTYYWQARAFHTQDSTQWTASWSFTTTFQMPTAPTLISPSNGSTNIALTGTAFQWNSVSGATSYEYAYADNSSFNNAITTSTSLLTGNSGALQGSTTYYWKVRASNGFGYSPWSTVWSFTTVIQYNVAPTLISPPNNTINIAISGTTLQWSSINGATVYEYQLALDSLFAGPQTGTTSLQSASTGSLQTAATYYWKVKAGNGSTWSPWSVVWHFSTINPMPTAPTLISPPDNSTNIPIAGTGLQWSSVAGATSYNYQYSTDSLFATAVSSNTSALTTTTAALSATTNYFWRVRASDGTNYSPWSVVWSFTTLTPSLAAPVLISPADNATGIPTSGASYQWSSVSGATFYEYQYDVDSLFTAPVVSTTSNTSATSAALQAGTVYFWRVRAGDGSIYSPWSTVWSFTTANLVLAAPLLTSPSDNSTNIPVTGTTLQWQGVSGATFYESMYDIDSLFTNPVSGNTGNLSISTLTLLSNTEYFWKVRAGNGLIYSPWSEIWSFITEPATGIQLTPANKELVVYPNPSQGNFSVQIPDASGGTVQIIITDLLGNIVFGNDNINDNNITLKLQNISNGTYILAYTRGTKKITKPIIIAR
jgi:hypothetical protein